MHAELNLNQFSSNNRSLTRMPLSILLLPYRIQWQKTYKIVIVIKMLISWQPSCFFVSWN